MAKIKDTKAKPKAATAAQKLEAFGMDAICQRTADITPQRTIAAEIGVSWATMMRWIDSTPERVEQYARAREAQADKLAEDVISIADELVIEATYKGEDVTLDVSSSAVARNRLRVDARKWLASKMAPKRYGDRLALDADVKVTKKLADMTDDELMLIAARNPNV